MAQSNYSSAATAYGNQLVRWKRKVVLVEHQTQLVTEIMMPGLTNVNVVPPNALSSVESAGLPPFGITDLSVSPIYDS